MFLTACIVIHGLSQQKDALVKDVIRLNNVGYQGCSCINYRMSDKHNETNKHYKIVNPNHVRDCLTIDFISKT